MSISKTDLVRLWLQERFFSGPFLPLALVLALCSSAGASAPTPTDLAMNTVLAFFMLLQFRAIDDLADLTSDRLQHPDRILCRAKSIKPIKYVAAIAGLFAAILLLIIRGRDHVAALAGLNLFAFLWYSQMRTWFRNPIVNYHLLLLKYPLFLWILRPLPPWTLDKSSTLTAALIYLGACLHEGRSDPKHCNEPAGQLAGKLHITFLVIATVTCAVFAKSTLFIAIYAAITLGIIVACASRLSRLTSMRFTLPASSMMLATVLSIESWT